MLILSNTWGTRYSAMLPLPVKNTLEISRSFFILFTVILIELSTHLMLNRHTIKWQHFFCFLLKPKTRCEQYRQIQIHFTSSYKGTIF